jgi:hypothetical protein
MTNLCGERPVVSNPRNCWGCSLQTRPFRLREHRQVLRTRQPRGRKPGLAPDRAGRLAPIHPGGGRRRSDSLRRGPHRDQNYGRRPSRFRRAGRRGGLQRSDKPPASVCRHAASRRRSPHQVDHVAARDVDHQGKGEDRERDAGIAPPQPSDPRYEVRPGIELVPASGDDPALLGRKTMPRSSSRRASRTSRCT